MINDLFEILVTIAGSVVLVYILISATLLPMKFGFPYQGTFWQKITQKIAFAITMAILTVIIFAVLLIFMPVFKVWLSHLFK